MKILLVDDSPEILEELNLAFKDFFKVTLCNDAVKALALVNEFSFDAIVVDIQMPVMDGFALVEKIKNLPNFNNCPLFFLTANKEMDVKMRALGIGVEDFLNKLMAPEILIARIQNKIDRFKDKFEGEILSLGNMRLDETLLKVYINDQAIELTQIETKILAELINNKGSLVLRTDICSMISPAKPLNDATLNTHVSHLRKKISNFNGQLVTIRGKGLKLVTPDMLYII